MTDNSTPSTNFSNHLANTVPNTPSTRAIPQGKYETKIMSASVEVIPDQGYDHVSLQFRVEAGTLKDQVLDKHYHLKSRKARNFLQNEFKKMGQDVTRRDELAPACDSLMGKNVMVSVEYPNGNQTVYVVSELSKPKAVLIDPEAIWS